jgi:hypothetical protein
MSEICQIITRTIGEQFSCSTVKDFVRIRTPYLYPDGDFIDLYLKKKEDGYILTDLGETLRWLRMQTVSRKRTKKQEELIRDTLLTFNIHKYKGMLIRRFSKEEEMAAAVTDLSQAAFRISDIWFTFRTRTSESIIDEVAEFLDEQKIKFETNKQFDGRSGRKRKVDFYIKNSDQESLIEVLSTASKPSANTRADTVHTVWSDLSYLQENYGHAQFISLFDDDIDIWTTENFNLLEQVSTIAYWTRKEEFKDMLFTSM